MRIGAPLLLAAAAMALASCLDDPAVRERAGLDEYGRPLPDASRFVTDNGTPTPTPAVGTPPPSPPPTASASAVPVPTGQLDKTFDPLDAAIDGPGYFVLSTQPSPAAMSDLLFTRHGSFELQFLPEASPAPLDPGPGTWRLMTAEGLHVLGFDWEGPDGGPMPAESSSTSFELAFTLRLATGRTVQAAPIAIDARANPNLWPSWNFKGQLLSINAPPLGAGAEPRQIYLAIAQFDHPQALKPRAALRAFEYAPEAGPARVGLAGVRPGEAQPPRPVGEATMILPATLER